MIDEAHDLPLPNIDPGHKAVSDEELKRIKEFLPKSDALAKMEYMEDELKRLGKYEEVDKEYSIAAPYIKSALRMFEEVTECPMCGGLEVMKYGPTGLVWKYYRCKCGMVFQTHYMPADKLEWYYKEIYRLCVRPFSDRVTDEAVFGETDSGIKYLVRSGAVPKRHLDIGSSTGSFLRVMNVAYKCDVVGVEPGDVYREYSNKRGIPTFKDISEVGGTFDFISMCHVLEHLINPMEVLATVWSLLDDDGRLYVEVPYANYAFSHPIVFDGDTLTEMLAMAGFEVIDTVTEKKFIFANAVKGSQE